MALYEGYREMVYPYLKKGKAERDLWMMWNESLPRDQA